MVRLDNLFSKKASPKTAPEDAGPSSHPADADPSADRKAMRMERREMLYGVVRESMTRVGMLSTSYKFKVLSLDALGNTYLVMMDLPREMAEQVQHLPVIEATIKENAKSRHGIDVSAVYWRISDLLGTAVLRKPRPEGETKQASPAPALASMSDDWPIIGSDPRKSAPSAPTQPLADRGRRFEPIRSDEVKAFKQGLGSENKSKPAPAPSKPRTNDFAPTQMAPHPDFEATRLNEDDRMPLSRTQFGDLI